NLRQLQDKSALNEILIAIQEIQSPPSGNQKSKIQSGRCGSHLKSKPVLVKVAPDLSFEALDEILELVGPREIAGIVAPNTTINRPASTAPEVQRVYAEAGGLSGRPLRARSTDVGRHLFRQTRGRLPKV